MKETARGGGGSSRSKKPKRCDQRAKDKPEPRLVVAGASEDLADGLRARIVVGADAGGAENGVGPEGLRVCDLGKSGGHGAQKRERGNEHRTPPALLNEQEDEKRRRELQPRGEPDTDAGKPVTGKEIQAHQAHEQQVDLAEKQGALHRGETQHEHRGKQ